MSLALAQKQSKDYSETVKQAALERKHAGDNLVMNAHKLMARHNIDFRAAFELARLESPEVFSCYMGLLAVENRDLSKVYSNG